MRSNSRMGAALNNCAAQTRGPFRPRDGGPRIVPLFATTPYGATGASTSWHNGARPCYPVAVAQLVQIAQAVAKAGVSRRTIYRWLKDGSLKRFKRGGDPYVLVDLAAVRQLRKPRQVPPKRSG